MADGEVIVGATGTLADEHIATAVAQVLSLSVALTSVTDDGNRLALQTALIRIVVIIYFDRHLFEFLSDTKGGNIQCWNCPKHA